MIGTVLAGRYRVIGLLGGGGMSVVYKATDQVTGDTVAVKALRAEYASDAAFLRRLRREAEAVRRLSHPGVVAVRDVAESDGHPFLVLEYVEGITLKQYIREHAPLPVEEAVSIACRVLAVLEHAHAHGVIHRDVKPQNILITSDDQVMVTDFGIARASWATTTVVENGAMVGTAHYFAPEQARGLPASERSDLYAVGVILFEMLTGRLPFEGDSPVAVAMQHLEQEPPRPSALNPAVPAALEAIVLKALAKDPARRYPSAAAMREDLERFLAGEPVVALAEEEEEAQRTLVVPPGGDAPILPAAGTPGSVALPVPAGDRVPARPAAEGDEKRQAQAGRDARAARRRRAWWLAVGVLAILVLAFGAGVARRWLTPPLVQVPVVEGLPLIEAQARLERAGLQWQIREERHDNSEVNTVIDQDPPGGEQVRPGSTVSLVVSKGPEWLAAPDVRGLSERDARIRLENAGLAASVRYRHDQAAPGTVIEQDPGPGSPIQAGMTVYLTVSEGPEERSVQVPSLFGLVLDDARAELQRVGLRAGEVREVFSDYPAGTVIGQNPPAATAVRPGTAVALVVSKGDEPPPQPATREARLSVDIRGEGRHVLRVEVQDAAGRRVVYEKEHRGGDKVDVPVTWQGEEARVLVFLDGELVEERTLTAEPGGRKPGKETDR
ncbi:MAG: Stk1 family PASTA domain-containing Ser/Thr kinase [Bacillota bacterium]|nr:MAG: Stk1 family PASTA domain-containing Ser/Thr kinase [Bacillota bacterium]